MPNNIPTPYIQVILRTEILHMASKVIWYFTCSVDRT